MNAKEKAIEYISEIDPTFNQKKHKHIVKGIDIAIFETAKEIFNKLDSEAGFEHYKKTAKEYGIKVKE